MQNLEVVQAIRYARNELFLNVATTAPQAADTPSFGISQPLLVHEFSNLSAGH